MQSILDGHSLKRSIEAAGAPASQIRHPEVNPCQDRSVRDVALDGASDRACDPPQVAGIAGDEEIAAGQRARASTVLESKVGGAAGAALWDRDASCARQKWEVKANGGIQFMTTRERAHKLLDELPESEIEPVLEFIASCGEDPVIAAFRDAPEDDEPWTEEDEAAMAEVEADRAAGVPTIPFEEIKRKYGLA
jgi:hypothetical protein